MVYSVNYRELILRIYMYIYIKYTYTGPATNVYQSGIINIMWYLGNIYVNNTEYILLEKNVIIFILHYIIIMNCMCYYF